MPGPCCTGRGTGSSRARLSRDTNRQPSIVVQAITDRMIKSADAAGYSQPADPPSGTFAGAGSGATAAAGHSGSPAFNSALRWCSRSSGRL